MAGLKALAEIGLDSYVAALIERVAAGLPPGVTSTSGRTVAAWTSPPTETAGRAQVALDWPLDLWHDPVQVAAYLAHEATHAYRWNVDPATWADEAAPQAVEFVVRWALAKRPQPAEHAVDEQQHQRDAAAQQHQAGDGRLKLGR